MAFSPNSPQSREMTELRNHLKWLDEERRKTARKLGEVEQRIAQQGREIAEREKRIHELEWQLAQVSERIEQMPEMGTGASGQEQRLQDLEWHMSNINAQLVRLPKLDEELVNFREEIAQYTVDIENRLVSQQTEAAQRLENDVYSRLREDVTQAVVGYDGRLTALQVDINDNVERQIAMSVQSVQEDLQERITRIESSGLGDSDRLAELERFDPSTFVRIADLQNVVQANDTRLAELASISMANDARLAELASINMANDARLADTEATRAAVAERLAKLEALGQDNAHVIGQLQTTLNELKLDDGSLAAVAAIEQELELRQAEEIRLANLIGVQESKFEYATGQIEEMNRVVADMQKHYAVSEANLAELGRAIQGPE